MNSPGRKEDLPLFMRVGVGEALIVKTMTLASVMFINYGRGPCRLPGLRTVETTRNTHEG